VERNVAVIRQLARRRADIPAHAAWAADLERSGDEVAELPDRFWRAD